MTAVETRVSNKTNRGGQVPEGMRPDPRPTPAHEQSTRRWVLTMSDGTSQHVGSDHRDQAGNGPLDWMQA